MATEKVIYDPIHGYMSFSDECLKIIDSIYFKRLQNIKQTGLLYHVFPGATHTRFEHSLGVAYLAERLMKNLRDKQPELCITSRTIELVKIAGLCHDLGHGPFSHSFDNEFIKKNPSIRFNQHEDRSVEVVLLMSRNGIINLSHEEEYIVFEMINPTNNDIMKYYLYEIVNNKNHGVDVDKFDYLKRDAYHIGLDHQFDCSRFIECARVINGRLCYQKQCVPQIRNLFNLRYNLHMTIYNHHTVKAIEVMTCEILMIIDKWDNICAKVDDPEEFYKLDDSIIENALYLYDKNIIKDINYNLDMDNVNHLYNRIKKRELFKTEYNMDPNDINCDHWNHPLNISTGEDNIYNVPIYSRERGLYYESPGQNENMVLTILKE